MGAKEEQHRLVRFSFRKDIMGEKDVPCKNPDVVWPWSHHQANGDPRETNTDIEKSPEEGSILWHPQMSRYCHSTRWRMRVMGTSFVGANERRPSVSVGLAEIESRSGIEAVRRAVVMV
jgi:hypothetical protein